MVKDVLDNPVYHALLSGDAALSLGTGEVRYFDQHVSPFAGFHHDYTSGFGDLFDQLPAGRRILYARPQPIEAPAGWRMVAAIPGLQFILDTAPSAFDIAIQPVPLGTENVAEMVQLAALTKPGPFSTRTIEFGHYFGIFENGRLASMTGQRLHVNNYTEISAVCTHPDFLGRGYAANLLQHQLQLIIRNGQIPFLHVRSDNDRAIALYERLGFKRTRPMNFYFLERK